MKKLLHIVLASSLLVSSVHAETTTEETYSTVDAPYLTLKATQGEEGEARLEWNPASFVDFNSWRVVRSATSTTPSYPEDGYIFYDTNPSTKAFIDVIAPNGIQYYRVCAITKNLTRYCSNTVEMNIHDGNQGYNPIVSDTDLTFTGEMTPDGALLTWTPTEKEDFIYYYIVKSKTKPNPIFPNDGYDFYSNYQSTDTFLDTNAEGESAYYRLYVITSDGGRYASKTIEIDYTQDLTQPNDDTQEEDTPAQEEDTNEETPLQEKFQSKLKDIATNKYYDSILYAEMNGYITGYEDETFRPDNTINRAEFAKILAQAMYETLIADNCFTDVDTEDWFSAGICTLKEKGVVKGYNGNKFGISQNINAAEALKITLLANGTEITETTDEAWYAPYWAYAVENNILPPTVYSPEQDITRSEMTYMIYKINSQDEQ